MGATEPSQIEKLKFAAEQEVEKIFKLHESSNSYLDLVAKSIFQIPEALFRFPNLEILYLESNHLEELPEDFFENLPMLKWLDLRDNRLEYLPPSIGVHRNLKTILLERNQLTHLPPELGLSLRGNPLEYPPPNIIEQGVQVILSYLLDDLNASGGMSDNEDKDDWEFGNGHVREYSDGEDRFTPQSVNSDMNCDHVVPHELARHGPTPVPAMFHQPKSRMSPWKERNINGTSSGKLKVKDITLTNTVKGENREQMNRKEWLAKMQQKKQHTMVLDEWRREAKILQKLLVPKSRKELDKSRPLPPYGIDSPTDGRPVTKEERQIHVDAIERKVDRVNPKNSKPNASATETERKVPDEDMEDEIKSFAKLTRVIMEVVQSIASRSNDNNNVFSKNQPNPKSPPKETYARRAKSSQSSLNRANLKSPPKETNTRRIKSSQDRERIDNEVQARIRQHTSRLRSRKQKDDSKEPMLQPGRELQRELLDQKMSKNQAGLEYRFRAFTGDSSSFSSSKKTSSL